MRGKRSPRPAFTLVELLVVMAILAALATLTAIFFPGFQDKEIVNQGADKLQGWLLIAKQQARRDGLPTGLRLTLDTTNPNYCFQLSYIQQPESYAQGFYTGFTSGAPGQGPTATFTLPTGVTFNTPITLTGASEAFVVQVGDYLELYGGGVLHRIAAVGTNTLTLEATTAPLPPVTNPPSSTNYRIIPQPRLISGEQTLTLPDAVAIDFTAHPLNGNQPLSQRVPSRNGVLEVLFAPSGAVVGQGTGTGQIVFWVRNTRKDNTNDLLGGTPRLIVVQPRTGFIAAHPVSSGSDPYLFIRDGRSSGL